MGRMDRSGGANFLSAASVAASSVAWLCPVKMPGGDGAARFPVQAAAGFWPRLAGQSELPDMAGPPWNFPPRFATRRDGPKKCACFASSSVGRLFDAVAALVGFTREATFEGQAAIWLEHLATTNRAVAASPRLQPIHFPISIIARCSARFWPIGRRSVTWRTSAPLFTPALARGVIEQVCTLARQRRIRTVAISGGVFQNELLLDAIVRGLDHAEPALRILTNEAVPAGDGGICLGQAALAGIRK